jgi:hypothetical protein
MTPALEYLIRSGLIRQWFSLPCSLFLFQKETFSKLVITINEEFKPSDFYSVKHWHVDLCEPESALPAMTEYRVPKDRVFDDSAIIVPTHKLVRYQQDSVPSHHNSYKSPMSLELYGHFFDHMMTSFRHQNKRTNWLWSRFVRIYAPDLCDTTTYISSAFRSEAEIAEDQRDLVSKHLKKQWQYWQLWQSYMLQNPGELIFYKEYLNANN